MTSFAVNNGWTPELIAQDMALKEKYGKGAHVTPVRTFEIPANMNKLDCDTVQFSAKKEQNKKTGLKALLITGLAVLAATGIYVATRGKAKKPIKIVNEPIKTKLSPEILDQRLAPKTKPGAWSKQEMTKYYTDLEAGKNLIKDTIREGDTIIYKYADNSLITEKEVYMGVEGPKSKFVALKLKDGKRLELQYKPNNPNALFKFPEWTAWEDGKLDMGIYGVSSMNDALEIFKRALKQNNIDHAQILAAMKQEFI